MPQCGHLKQISSSGKDELAVCGLDFAFTSVVELDLRGKTYS